MPLVTVPVRPSGEPIATTWSPTATAEESPSVAVFSPLAPRSLISARSLSGSVPTTSAVYVLPVLSVTLIDEAPEMTWLLVTISPSEVMTTPEPVDSPAVEVALISTIIGETALATPETVPLLLCETVVPGTTSEAALFVPPPVSCSTTVAVPPPTIAAAIATAASRATGRLARCRGAAGSWGAGGGKSGPAGPVAAAAAAAAAVVPAGPHGGAGARRDRLRGPV